MEGLRIYKLSATCLNGPSEDTNACFLIAFNYDGWAKAQILVNVLSYGIYFRYKSSDWKVWRRLDTVEI